MPEGPDDQGDPGDPVRLVDEGPRTALARDVRLLVQPRVRDISSVRAGITWWLLAIFSGTILLAFLAIWGHWATEEQVKDLLTLLVPAQVSLLGAATAFYFAEKQQQRAD